MGLDVVELILALEEEFGIEIADDDAFKIETVRDMTDYLYFKVRDRKGDRWNIETAEREFLIALAKVAKMEADQKIEFNKRLSDVFPLNVRKKRWRELRIKLNAGEYSWPKLKISPVVKFAIFAISIFVFALVFYLSSFILAAFFTIPCLIFLIVLALPFRRSFPHGIVTAKDLFKEYYSPYRQGKVSYDVVMKRVKEITMEQLGVSASDVTDDARFIEDLGAD